MKDISSEYLAEGMHGLVWRGAKKARHEKGMGVRSDERSMFIAVEFSNLYLSVRSSLAQNRATFGTDKSGR